MMAVIAVHLFGRLFVNGVANRAAHLPLVGVMNRHFTNSSTLGIGLADTVSFFIDLTAVVIPAASGVMT